MYLCYTTVLSQLPKFQYETKTNWIKCKQRNKEMTIDSDYSVVKTPID